MYVCSNVNGNNLYIFRCTNFVAKWESGIDDKKDVLMRKESADPRLIYRVQKKNAADSKVNP